MDEWIKIIQNLTKRIDKLEKLLVLSKITVPQDGYLILDSQAADPPIVNGRIYYNTTTGKIRKCEGGAWKDANAA